MFFGNDKFFDKIVKVLKFLRDLFRIKNFLVWENLLKELFSVFKNFFVSEDVVLVYYDCEVEIRVLVDVFLYGLSVVLE